MRGNIENRCREGGGGGLQRARRAKTYAAVFVNTNDNGSNKQRERQSRREGNFAGTKLSLKRTYMRVHAKRAMHPMPWVPAL